MLRLEYLDFHKNNFNEIYEYNSKLSVLEWMIRNDLDGLKERVMTQLQPYFKEGDRLISDLFFTAER